LGKKQKKGTEEEKGRKRGQATLIDFFELLRYNIVKIIAGGFYAYCR